MILGIMGLLVGHSRNIFQKSSLEVLISQKSSTISLDTNLQTTVTIFLSKLGGFILSTLEGAINKGHLTNVISGHHHLKEFQTEAHTVHKQ